MCDFCFVEEFVVLFVQQCQWRRISGNLTYADQVISTVALRNDPFGVNEDRC